MSNLMTVRRATRVTETPAGEHSATHRELVDFDTFYRSNYRTLVGLGYVLSGDRTSAEDLAQDALAKLHTHWDRISDYDDPLAWTRRVLANAAVSRGRRKATEGRLLRRLRSVPPAELSLPESDHALWESVRQLPPRQAQAVALRYWNDLSVKEIALVLEVGEESVKTHLARGRATLRAQLGEIDA